MLFHVGSGGPNVATPTRPPGRASSRHRASASPGSGRKKRTRDAESRSNPPAPTPSSSGSWASTTRTSTWLRSSSAASAVDWATITGERSPPTAEPVGPTARAIGSRAAPLPQPRSRARSPGWVELGDQPVRDRLEEVHPDLVVAVGRGVEEGSERLALYVHGADPVVLSR